MKFENLPCSRCRELKDDHQGRKCLFQPTTYAAVGEMDVLSALLYTRDTFKEGHVLRFIGHTQMRTYNLEITNEEVNKDLSAQLLNTYYTITEDELFRLNEHG